MVDASSDHAGVRIPPPLVYLAGLLLGVAIHAVLWPLGLPLSGLLRALLALVLVGGGATLILASFQRFQQTGQDPKPWTPTPEIVADGVYRWTRNPMYVGLAAIQAGLGVALANGWVLLLVLPVLAIVYQTAIRHEEAYLERKFGDAYRNYRAAVRRWL